MSIHGEAQQLFKGTGKYHPNIRDFFIQNTTAYHLGPVNKPQGFGPAQYPQGIEIWRPMGEKLWFDFRNLPWPWNTWVQPKDNQGNDLPLEIYVENRPGAGDVAVYYKWL